VHLNSPAELDTIGIVSDGASQLRALMAGLKSDQIRSMAAIVTSSNNKRPNTELMECSETLSTIVEPTKGSWP